MSLEQSEGHRGNLHLAICEYAATGEGVTVTAAISGSQAHAASVFKEKADPFFHRGMELKALDPNDPQIQRLGKLLPIAAVADAIHEYARGVGVFYCELHFNNS